MSHGPNKKRKPITKHFDPTRRKTADTKSEDSIIDESVSTKDSFKISVSENNDYLDIIEGRNAVLEAIKAGLPLDKVFIAKGEVDSNLRYIASLARESGSVVVEVDKRKLDSMSMTKSPHGVKSHQGVMAVSAEMEYSTIDDILENAEKSDKSALVVICDCISDPHNMGAIIRTCEAVGAHGVIIPKRRSVGLNTIVAKASSGAIYHLPVARVSNISAAIKELKKSGFWIFGTATDGNSSLWETDFSVPCAIVIGSEGEGISRLVSENCDYLVSIPMFGKISSLNASVSAAIMLYEVIRQRRSSIYKGV